MPLFASKRSSALAASKKQNEALHALHAKGNGWNTTDKLQQESVKLMPTMKPPYRKIDSAKKEIRLLFVLPGLPKDPIRCQMHTTLLGSKKQLEYETVSYCWGADRGQAVIEIDRVPVWVTKSAAEVVHRMRSHERPRMIWIDAICINQSDMVERSAQVAIMGEIYRKTWCNFIWLGDDQGHLRAVQATIHAVIENIYANRHALVKQFRDKAANASPSSLRSGNMLDPRIDLSPLVYLFRSPWFGRLWVVQEAALPPRSMCCFGSGVLNLLDVLRVAFWLEYNSSQVPASVFRGSLLFQAKTLHTFIDKDSSLISKFDRSSVNLATLWDMFFKWECKEPKDKIYALLALQNNSRLPPIVPDYSRSDTSVFAEVTRRTIQESGNLGVLMGRFTTAMESPPKLPSWSVRFGLRAEVCPESFAGFFRACGDARLLSNTILTTKDPTVLSLSGILVDEIQVSRQLGLLQRRNMATVLKDIQHVARDHKSHEYFVKRLGTTLMGGRNMQNHPTTAQDMNDFATYLAYLQKYRMSPPVLMGTESLQVNEETRMASRAHGAVVYTCSLRCFFITKCGRFGVGPDGVIDSDLIVVLNGACWPVALRYVGKGKYYFIGACYVEGIMYGEAELRHKAEGKKDDAFQIL